ncbi:MAG TPA: hypothetical protein VKX49_12410 [Bryobacteraceae bacterium]|nr:hypothetical protein [Bryobacteraceae bacterium]
MTRIAEPKTHLKAETSAVYRNRPLIVELSAHTVAIHPKGVREAYNVPWLAVFELGQKLSVLETRKEKHSRRTK